MADLTYYIFFPLSAGLAYYLYTNHAERAVVQYLGFGETHALHKKKYKREPTVDDPSDVVGDKTGCLESMSLPDDSTDTRMLF